MAAGALFAAGKFAAKIRQTVQKRHNGYRVLQRFADFGKIARKEIVKLLTITRQQHKISIGTEGFVDTA